MSRNDPAFPAKAPNGDLYSGLTKREYFAAMAMQGAMVTVDIDSMCETGAAEVAVRLADALLAELEKEKP